MKLNENDAILTPRLLLVPYSTHHVPTYHTWMQSPELQALTASEPLTLDQEHEMQASWRKDADKLTFIICAAPDSMSKEESEKWESMGIAPGERDGENHMIGDVNLFLFDDDDEDEDEDNAKTQPTPPSNKPKIGELEIMLAHPSSRGHGLAREALLAFLWYITSSLPSLLLEYSPRTATQLRYLRVKIDHGNVRSIGLFERLGFERVGTGPNFFGEVELRMRVEGGKAVGVKGVVGEGVRRVRYGV